MADGCVADIRVRQKPFRAADLFCGAGGFSTGAKRAARSIGRAMQLVAVNHWPVAIETHRRNHPDDAEHTYCADLESALPLSLVPWGYLDLLLASPSCVFHSRARGGRPVHDQQRMDPWHVIRWCTELRVARIIIENVPEFMDWGPCSLVTGRPIARRKGEYFRAWCDALSSIGFRIDYRVLCAADYGDPTTRQRFILIGRSDGKRLRWPEPRYARGGVVDLLGERQPWRAAAEIIDWSMPGRSIFARSKPLRPNTVRRILAGALRYHWPRPYTDALQALLDGREPVLDVTAEQAAEIQQRIGHFHTGLVMATGAGGAARDLQQPIPTVTAGGDGGARPHFAYPLVAPYYGGGSGETSKPATEPLPAVTTKARFGLAMPLIVSTSNSSSTAAPRSADQPLRTITTAKGGDMGVAQPVIAGHRIDIPYRMLHWRELARAMSFDDEGEVYAFAGTGVEITKQIGNAVPGRMAKALVHALLEDSR